MVFCAFNSRVYKKIGDPLKEPQIQISLNLLYKLDSSECFELMIRKAAQDLTLGSFRTFVIDFTCVKTLCFSFEAFRAIQQIAANLNCVYFTVADTGIVNCH